MNAPPAPAGRPNSSPPRCRTGPRLPRYDALLVPGGVGNADRLRGDENAQAFVRAFFADGKPVAAISCAPATLIGAGVLAGRTVTSWPTVRTDVCNAGATWVDREVVVDGNLVTSREPDAAFVRTMIEAFAGALPRLAAAA